MPQDQSLEELKDRVTYLLSKIETAGAGGELRMAGSLAERNSMEMARLAEHGLERREFLAATRELRGILVKMGLA